jgi:zinc protease
MSLDVSSFGLVAVPMPGISLAEMETAMDGVIAKFMTDGVEPEAFERIKRQMRASEIYARDNVEGLAREYGTALTSGLTVADVQDWPEILQAVTPEEVMQAARDVFVKTNAVTGWLQRDDAVEVMQ